MKALRLLDLNQGLVKQIIPEPQPNAGEVIIKVKAAGLCHSDLHFIAGQIKVPRPLTLGHETSGIVIRTGPGVEKFKNGDRVAVYLGDTEAGDNKSMEQMIPGISSDGGLADEVRVMARNLVKIPDNVSFFDAAVATDAIATSYHAVKGRAMVHENMKVGIIGLGGLGLNGMRICHLLNATTLVADIDNGKLETARKEGAIGTENDFMIFKGQEPDVVIDFVGNQETLKAAQRVVKHGGSVVLVGLGAMKIEIHSFDLASREINLLGSFGATYKDLQEVMQLLSEGHLKMDIEKIQFDQVNEGLHRLHKGEVGGRLVVDMDS